LKEPFDNLIKCGVAGIKIQSLFNPYINRNNSGAKKLSTLFHAVNAMRWRDAFIYQKCSASDY